MRFRLIWVGKTKNGHVRALVEEYMGRLQRFVRCEVTEIERSPAKDDREGIADESRRILSALRNETLAVLLDVKGREWSSEALAAEVEKWQVAGTKEVSFVIGGHNGVSREVSKRANVHWSLSRLTLTHEMARIVLVEQLYRAYTIVHGWPYHKEG